MVIDIVMEKLNLNDTTPTLSERYLSLLTDLPQLDEEEVCRRRDDLTEQLSEVYKASLKTSPQAYKKA